MRKAVTLALLAGASWQAAAGEPADLGQVVVTAPPMSDPLTVVLDPKVPLQPVPASDGAAYLKNIPGFSMVRKGGTSGDPVFRGMSGSRLNILVDDASLLGGCGMRMDPPTAYVYPESYDRITVLKGPQTVLYGTPTSGATVRFERDTPRFDAPGVRAQGSLMAGSFGRNDQMLDLTAGAPAGYLRGIATRSDANSFDDGDGNEIRSFYTRWSGSLVAGWTPDADTRVEFSLDRSDAEAAYADRMMDGVRFDRTGYGLRVQRAFTGGLLERLDLNVFHNYVDHVMDNFSLRQPPAMAAMLKVSNPDRTTDGARAAFQLDLGTETFATVGADYQMNDHTVRMLSGADAPTTNLDSRPRMDDARFHQWGLFGELTHSLGEKDRMVTGLRQDWANAEALGTMTPYGGVAAGTDAGENLLSGFARWEHDLAWPATLYAGVGYAERAPDYWERAKSFNLDPERTLQLDLGATARYGRWQGSVSTFAAHHGDYILVTQVGAGYTARNIDARTLGLEADLAYEIATHWRLTGALAYVYGDNRTDDKPLAQMPPLEGRLGVAYDDGTWSGGLSVRGVARQDRVDIGSGGIASVDVGETPGFSVWSANVGYRPNKQVLLTAGVDNLFDYTYVEHISQDSFGDNPVTARVNEPGRSFWVKGNVTYK